MWVCKNLRKVKRKVTKENIHIFTGYIFFISREKFINIYYIYNKKTNNIYVRDYAEELKLKG